MCSVKKIQERSQKWQFKNFNFFKIPVSLLFFPNELLKKYILFLEIFYFLRVIILVQFSKE
jgi:hypothetical protein